jgi:WD40 repeat protein
VERLTGYSGHYSKNITWLSDNHGISKYIVYPCHSTVIKLNVKTGEQMLFLGHTNDVSIVATDVRTLLLATAQTGKNPIVRLWDLETGKCHAALQSHQNVVNSLSLSDSGNLMVGVGKDVHMKELIVIWDISKIVQTGQAPIVIQHACDYPITCMKFLPFEETKLISCGQENIRFWRLKGGIFRGCGLSSENYSLTKQDFLDCSFEKGFVDPTVCTLIKYSHP